jgi:DNA-binding transcriptional LysR family regulator
MSGEADLAIVPWYAEYATPSVHSQTLARVQASTVVSHDFPLLTREHLTPADLAPYIQVIERTEGLPGLASTSPLHPQSRHWYVQDVHTKKQVILSGGSYGVLPYHLISTELAEGRLVPLSQVEGFQMHPSEVRAVCRDREMGPALTALWQLLRK